MDELESTSVVAYEYDSELLVPDLECPAALLREYSDLFIDKTQTYCDSSYDTVLCWPPTVVGELARVSCPQEYGGIPLNPRGVATKRCIATMTWDKADYTPCFEGNDDVTIQEEETSVIERVLFIGHIISAVLLLIVLILHCIRKDDFLLKTIQRQVLLSFFAFSCVFLVMDVVVSTDGTPTEEGLFSSSTFEMLCKVFSALLNFFTVTSLFWMFVESLYIHWLVVYPNSVDKLDGWTCALIGWGIPQLLILVWVLLKISLSNTSCWMSAEDYYRYIEFLLILPILVTILLMLVLLLVSGCKLIKDDIRGHQIKHLTLNDVDKSTAVKKSTVAALLAFSWIGSIYIVNVLPPVYLPIPDMFYLKLLSISNGTKGAMLAVVYFLFNTWIPPAILKSCTKPRDTEELESDEDNTKTYPGAVV